MILSLDAAAVMDYGRDMDKTPASKPARFVCSCGCVEHHETWKRTTSDGKTVVGWSDGLITYAIGVGIPGVSARRSGVECALDIRAGWVVAGEVCVHTAAEMPAVIARARKAVRRRGATFEAIRAAIYGTAGGPPRPPGGWVVQSTDASGKATERVWRFPRLSPLRDCAIWNERGRYEVCTRMTSAPHGTRSRSSLSGNTFEPTGFVHTSLRDAFATCRTIMGVA